MLLLLLLVFVVFSSLETSGCVSALELSCECIRDYLLLKKVAVSSIISILCPLFE